MGGEARVNGLAHGCQENWWARQGPSNPVEPGGFPILPEACGPEQSWVRQVLLLCGEHLFIQAACDSDLTSRRVTRWAWSCSHLPTSPSLT